MNNTEPNYEVKITYRTGGQKLELRTYVDGEPTGPARPATVLEYLAYETLQEVKKLNDRLGAKEALS